MLLEVPFNNNKCKQIGLEKAKIMYRRSDGGVELCSGLLLTKFGNIANKNLDSPYTNPFSLGEK